MNKNMVILILVVIFMPSISFCKEFQVGPDISFDIVDNGVVLPSPNGDYVVVISSKGKTEIFRLSETEDTWTEFLEYNKGFTQYSEMGWGKNSSGEDLFFLGNKEKEVISMKEGSLKKAPEKASLIQEATYDSVTHRLRKILSRISLKDLGIKNKTIVGLPEKIEYVSDVSKGKDKILCKLENDPAKPYYCLDFTIGEKYKFDVAEYNPDYIGGKFSPNDNYVLLGIGYSPDGNYRVRGYLLLCSHGGEILEIVAKFEDREKGFPTTYFFWLNNNWIVYSDGFDLHFRKFIEE